MIKLRCSKLPNFMTCANSVLNPDKLQEVETENAAAETGTIIHALAEDLVKTGCCDLRHHQIRLAEIDGLERAHELLPRIEGIWKLAHPLFKEPILEEYLEARVGRGLYITGHIDLHEAFEKHALILDWKTGRQRVDHYHQVMGYAFLVWDKLKRPRDYELFVTVAYVEDGVRGLERMPAIRPADLEEWAAAVYAKAKDKRYVTSMKCVHCPLANTCSAHQEKQLSAVRVIKGTPGTTLRQSEAPADIVNQLKIIEDAVAQFKAGIREDVKKNGPIDLGDGTHYVLEPRANESLDTKKALEATDLPAFGLTPDDMTVAAKLSLPTLRKIVFSRAAKGDKSNAVDRLNEALLASQALRVTQSEQLWRRKK